MKKWLIQSGASNKETQDKAQNEDAKNKTKSSSTTRKRKYNETFLNFGFTFSNTNGEERPLCLICNETLANESFKPTKLKRHLENVHPELCNKSVEFFQRKLKELTQTQSIFKGHLKLNEKALRASYEASYLIAKAKKPFTIGEELVLPIACKISEIIHGKKFAEELSCIPLSNDTVKNRITEISTNQFEQLIERIKITKFAIQIDETTDVCNFAQLLAYVRYSFEDTFYEDLLFCFPLEGRATGENIFNVLNNFFKENQLLWEHCVGVCSDGAAAMTGKLNGLFARIKQLPGGSKITFTHCMIHREALVSKKLSPDLNHVLKEVVCVINFIKCRALNSRLFSQLCKDMGSDYKNLLMHAEVRWLSRGKSLKRVLVLKDEIRLFLIGINSTMADLFCDESFMLKLCYLTDIFDKLNELNLSLQGKHTNIINLYDKIKGFVQKLNVWKLNLEKNQIDMFQYTMNFIDENELNISDIKNLIVSHLSALETEFGKYFSSEFNISQHHWIIQPFNIKLQYIQHLDIKAQEEFAELSCDSSLEALFKNQITENFWLSIKKEYPCLSEMAVQIILPFSTTYLCENAFSSLLYIKSKYRSRLHNIENVLRPALSEIEPQLTLLCSKKQAQPSH